MKQKNERFNSVPTSVTPVLAIVIFICSLLLVKKMPVVSVVLIISSVLIVLEKAIKHLGRVKKLKEYMGENPDKEDELQNNEALFKSLSPIAGVRIDGSLAWYNSAFKELFGTLSDKKISELIPEIKVREVYDDTANTPITAKINDDVYNIRTTVKRRTSPDHAAIMLYMEKVTELLETKDALKKAQNAVAHIMIDNYDEAIDEFVGEERLDMIALLDKNIYGWAQDAGCLIKKLEKDKFLCAFTRAELEIFIKNKFDILSNVKSFNPDAKIPPTVSIGIGVGDESFIENDLSARKALEMALGRGGDQVVLRENGNFRYFGGNSKETEKRTKVKSRIISHNLRELIENSENVLIMGHQNIDADAIGAAVGIASMANFIKKEAKVLFISQDETVRLLLKKIEENQYHDGMFIGKAGLRDYVTEKTLLVICDTHVPEYTEFPELIDTIKTKVVIDHHRRSESFISGADLVFHEPFASSTCEMVAELMQYFDARYSVPTVDAEILFAGIVMDTKNFTFKTGVRTFEAAAYLRASGVDTVHVKKLFRESIDNYKLKARIVTEAQLYSDNIAISLFTDNVPHVIVAAAADEMLDITDIKASFVIAKNSDGDVIISGRSMGEINVQVVLEKLGGGGHMLVAGAQLSGISVSDAGELLKNAIDQTI